jgi:hypothetical protein
MIYWTDNYRQHKQQSLDHSIVYIGQSAMDLVISSDVCMVGCDNRLGTCRPH